jgi:hypothetical protein
MRGTLCATDKKPTDKLKPMLFYLIQITLSVLFLYLAYLPTDLMDFFQWGSSQTDGLYLLIVPLILLPSIIILSIFKFFIVKKTTSKIFYRWSYMVTILSIVICTFLIVVELFWLVIILSILTVGAISIETIKAYRVNS